MKRSVLFMTVLIVFCPKSFAADKVALTCPQWIERLKAVIEYTTSNIVNWDTTRTPVGGPYKVRGLSCDDNGVFCEVREFDSKKLVYSPDHVDANEDGYVAYPDINVVDQAIELAKAMNNYEKAIANCD